MAAHNRGPEQKKGKPRGRPFQPGNSANPGGRPKSLVEVMDLARQHTPQAIATLAGWMTSEDAKASVAACNALLDRAWGKPQQTIDASVKMDIGAVIDAMRAARDA